MTDLLTMPTEVKSVIANEVIVQTVTDGDTTHMPSADAVYDVVDGKEAKANKSSSITTDTGSTTKYPTVKAVEDYVENIIGDIEEDMLS